MNIVVAADLSQTTVTRPDGAFFILGATNPETRQPWVNEAEVQAMVQKLIANGSAWTTAPVSLISVSPVQFKLLWTSAERLSLKTLRSTDPVLEDFFDILEDPRLTEVDLYLQSTIDGVTYAVNALVTAGTLTSENAATRISEILSGEIL